MTSSFAPIRPLCRSAFRAGSLAGFVARPSRRSPSGVVVVAVFRSPTAAGGFAARWSQRLGVGVAVRRLRGPGGAPRWAVSLPVAGDVPFGYWAHGILHPSPHKIPVQGGVRGLPAAVDAVSQAVVH